MKSKLTKEQRLIKKLIAQLEASNITLNFLRTHESETRAKVMQKMMGKRPKFTYIDLDSLDDVTCLIMANRDAIVTAQKSVKS